MPHILTNWKNCLLLLLSCLEVQVAYPYADKSRSMAVRTVAICAGSGGSMLLGREADVYLTGEMMHVRIFPFAGPRWLEKKNKLIVQWPTHSTRFWLQWRLENTSFFVSITSLFLCHYYSIVKKLNSNRFQGGHTNTERGYLPILATKLHHELQAHEFKDQGLEDVEVLVSEKDCHPLEFVWIVIRLSFRGIPNNLPPNGFGPLFGPLNVKKSVFSTDRITPLQGILR